jgi:hypothetical protein
VSGGQLANVEVQSDGLVPVEFAKHRDDGATLVLSNQRSGETAEAAAGRLAAAAESGRLGSLREGGEQGTGAVPQNWPVGLRAGLAQKPGVVSVPQLARSDPARAESGLANPPACRPSREPAAESQSASSERADATLRLHGAARVKSGGLACDSDSGNHFHSRCAMCARLSRRVQAWLRHLFGNNVC